MAKFKKEKYVYNASTLHFEKVPTNWRRRILLTFLFACSSLFVGIILMLIAYQFIDSPKEAKLKQDIGTLEDQIKLMNRQFDQSSEVLDDLRERDKNIYRVLFESEPIPDEIWQAGIGGAQRYKELQTYNNSELLIRARKKLDKLRSQLAIQSKSYDQISILVKNKEEFLACIPSIQPIANKDLKRIASGFGVRIDPVYGTPRMHTGIDFTAVIGTPIYATGKGIIETVTSNSGGYGNEVIVDHGYGYKTLYGHMSRFNCKPGQKVNRGEIIGFVGSTGKSVGPHVHYEVIYHDEKINPIHFFYNDLTQEQYAQILELSNNAGRTLD